MADEPEVQVISNAQFAKVQEWMDSKGVSNECESCGENSSWAPGPVVKAAGVDLTKGTADRDNPSIATFQMLCRNCGYIRHYSAGVIGLL